MRDNPLHPGSLRFITTTPRTMKRRLAPSGSSGPNLEGSLHIRPERLIVTADCGFGREALSRRFAFHKMVALVQGGNIVRHEFGVPEAEVGRGPALRIQLRGLGRVVMHKP